MGKMNGYQESIVPEDIHSSPRTYLSKDPALSITAGCPCDVCDLSANCTTMCARFNRWVNKGPTQQERRDEEGLKKLRRR